MSTAPSRAYAARLVGLPIFDPQGDQVGKVRDLVVALRSEASQTRVLGMVGEVFGMRALSWEGRGLGGLFNIAHGC